MQGTKSKYNGKNKKKDKVSILGGIQKPECILLSIKLEIQVEIWEWREHYIVVIQ